MNETAITSAQNPTVKLLRSLKDKAGRAEHGWYLVEGEKLIREALAAGLKPGPALADAARLEQWQKTLRDVETAGGRVYPCPARIVESVADTQSPQGVLCAFAPPPPLSLESAPKTLAALDGVQDPGNVGSIWRTADAAGLGGLLMSDGSADPLAPKVQRAAMGSSFRLPALRAANFPAALGELKARGYQIVVSTLSGADIYAQRPAAEKYVLVVGSEARGVSPEVCASADLAVKLPMRGGAESLNAAVAAGIFFYTWTRRVDECGT